MKYIKIYDKRQGENLIDHPPFSDQEPTKEDIKLTQEMKQIGRMMRIPLKDHVIIGKGWFLFFKAKRMENN